jgi:hypothetical protein
MSPPLPLPDSLMGDEWRFAALTAVDLQNRLIPRPIPILGIPHDYLPSTLQLPPQTLVPGIIIYGGKHALRLGQWLAEQKPQQLQFISGELSGVTLTTQVGQRWVLLTFQDPEVIAAAHQFEDRKARAIGLHFLLVQPDDSGVTETALFILRPVIPESQPQQQFAQR